MVQRYNPEDINVKKEKWSQLSDSNRRPTDYKSIALPTELSWRLYFSENSQNSEVFDFVNYNNYKNNLYIEFIFVIIV